MKKFILAVMALITALAFVGCGSSDSGKPAPETPPVVEGDPSYELGENENENDEQWWIN